VVTIQHSGVPPFTDLLAEQFVGRVCGASLDLGGMGRCKHGKTVPEFFNAVGTHSVVVVVK
jgi:hypothetical protein